ncbi:MAG: hypothetical protein ACR2LK_04850 [Solirubrobacteraceae bacterium]
MNQPSWTVVYTTCAAAIAVAGGFALVGRHGATGVAAALCGALVLTIPPFGAVAARLLDLRVGELARALAPPMLAIAAPGAVFAAGRILLPGFRRRAVRRTAGTAAYGYILVRFVLDAASGPCWADCCRRRSSGTAIGDAGSAARVGRSTAYSACNSDASSGDQR